MLTVAACLRPGRAKDLSAPVIIFFYTFIASKIFIKFINNLVIKQPIEGNTWDWIKLNISPQLTSR
jgi:hypothetical protein